MCSVKWVVLTVSMQGLLMHLFRICMEYCKKIYYVRTDFVCIN